MTAKPRHLWSSGAPTASQGEDDFTPRPLRQRRSFSNAPGLQPRWAAQVERGVGRGKGNEQAACQLESRLRVGGSGGSQGTNGCISKVFANQI